MICSSPSCHQWFDRSPMTREVARAETMRALVREGELPEAEAKTYLGITLLRIALELRGQCPNCVLNAQADARGTVETTRQVDAQLAAVSDPHVCIVYPFRRVQR